MATKSCENCAKQFEGDENQIYCSTVCKQQAYRKRKNEKTEEILLMQFSLEEYQKILHSDLGIHFKDNLLLYCFMRKNLPQQISFENLVIYLKNNITEFQFITSLERDHQNSAYKIFYEKYMAGEISIVEKY